LIGRAIRLAVAIVGVCALAAGMLLYGARDREDGFYLQNAELVDPDFLKRLLNASARDPSVLGSRPPVFAHRLKQGRGVVFGYRWYSNGRIDIVDDELYLKLTVWFPDGMPPENADISLNHRSHAIVVFTSGSSAWPKYACSGYISPGWVRIANDEGSYRVEVHGTLRPSTKVPGLNQCSPARIDRDFLTHEIAYAELTPWLGRAGSQPLEETYRYGR
jgi:hypothetical protein